MCGCEPTNHDHCLAQRWLDNAIAHAHDEQEEEAEGVAAGVEDGDHDHEDLRADVGAVHVLVVVEAPCEQHLHDEEDDDGRDVVLHGQDVVSMLHVEERPEDPHDRIYQRHAPIERQFRDLRGGQLAVCIAELDGGGVFGHDATPGADTVVACARDLVRVRLGVFDGGGGGEDGQFGGFVGVVSEEELAAVGRVAEVLLDGAVVADVVSLFALRSALSFLFLTYSYDICGIWRTSSGLSGTGLPNKFLSWYSNMTRLTGSSMAFGFCLNMTWMKGSTEPPHDFLLYMPEHRCVLSSFWSYAHISRCSSFPIFSSVHVYAASARLRRLRRDMFGSLEGVGRTNCTSAADTFHASSASRLSSVLHRRMVFV